MARGAIKTDEQKLELIENEIAEMDDRKAKIQLKINELNAQKKDILESINTKKLAELAKALDEAGKSVDDVLEMLKSE